MTSPIRVGFLGLSKSGWARNAHLPYLKQSDKYQIVAICNSSAKSAQEAIDLYELPASTRAYGDPEELAKDKDVDLVVCSVRVDRHLETIGPSLKAGKDVFVEWPLGKSYADAKELLRLKNEGNVKTAVVGLQARQAAVIRQLREIVQSGKIGDVLSSNWSGYATNLGESTGVGLDYLGQREVGGNLVTIHFGHAVDYIQQVLGYDFQSPPKSLLANRRKTMKLLDDNGNLLEAKHPKTSDDTIFFHGTLSSKIAVSITLRGGKPFPGTPGLDWRIYGEKGEIRITATGPFLQMGYPDLLVEVVVSDKEGKEKVELETDEFDTGEGWKEAFGLPARNVARLYKSLAEGKNNCTFEDAVQRHALIEAMYKENGIQG